MAALFAFSACSSDDPVNPDDKLTSTVWRSVHNAPTDTYFEFNLEKNDSGYATVRMFNIAFKSGDKESPRLNIRVDAPLTRKGDVFTYEGTNLVPFLTMRGTEAPVEQFIVTNFRVVVDVKQNTYSISFNCHGGEYKNSGTIAPYTGKSIQNGKLWCSTHTDESQEYSVFNLEKNDNGCATVELHNVVFTIGDKKSPAFQKIRIDAPMTNEGNVYTYEGTDITPFLSMNGVDVPVEQFKVTNFKAVVNVENKTYSIFFNCHGGEYKKSGTVVSLEN